MNISAALKDLGCEQGKDPFTGKWQERNWMNTPGTIYCGQTDNCFTGPLAAPNNVFVDDDSYEVIFRQPNTLYELRQVIKAAEWDPLQGYSMDGDSHWTIEAIKAWWSRVGELKDNLTKTIKKETDKDRRDSTVLVVFDRWLLFLNEEAKSEIREYMFYLETGRYPSDGEQLPDV